MGKKKKRKGEYSFSGTILIRKIAKFRRKMIFEKNNWAHFHSIWAGGGGVRGPFFVPAFLLSGQILEACCNSMLNPTWDVHLWRSIRNFGKEKALNGMTANNSKPTHGAHSVAHWSPAVLSWWDDMWEGGKYADVILPTLGPDYILHKERFSWRTWRAW
jgi:hypothetical protein